MPKDGSGPDDPKALIADAYRIEGIDKAECRSVFLDWALSVQGDPQEIIPRLLAGRPDHPMTDVLREGLGQTARRGRRGGRAARVQACVPRSR
ncbi:hypothetical protein MWU52_02315 [Jannaschia sp. S6380]|uniref:hypothetical protein n=1 Tax=Jannaschia sp. S6380 TaxID=2926408 RepID=UPI001FF1E1CA|nr:hypothetical protein [Jannaschia sp. S6380]MCK0166377.1 hypothetical protein [Jannaschia sp. S6380]